MTTHSEKTVSIESLNLLLLVVKWKKPLLILTIAAIAVSAVASFVIKPKYKAVVSIFPAKSNSVSKAIFSPHYLPDQDVLRFGEEEDAERLLEILNSVEIMNIVAAKYDLLNHYEIEPDEPFKMTRLMEEYQNNISFKRTEFQSVHITVLDHSPDTAAMIANDIASFLDTTMMKLQKSRAEKALDIIQNEYFGTEKYINQMEDSMTMLRKFGVHDYEQQVRGYTKEYSKAIADGKTSAAKAIEEKLNLLAKYGSAYVSLRTRLSFETEKFTGLRTKYDEAQIDVQQRMPYKFIVDHAFRPDKKYYPIRWLIVAVSTIAALLMGILTIIAIENYTKYTQRT